MSCLRPSRNSGWSGLRLRSPHAATLTSGSCRDGSCQRALPFFPEVHEELTKSESELWLNLTEIKDVDKTVFLDSPVSPSGLFSPAVDGFAERFNTAQTSSQAMQHFFHSSSSSSSHPKPAPIQQPGKTTLSENQLTPRSEPRQRSRFAKRYPLPK